MTISTGDMLPDVTLIATAGDGPEAVQSQDLAKGRKIVIFGLPGAFTGVCSTAHVPSFIRNREKLAEKGVDEVICVSCNDFFVMKAWDEATGASKAGVTMLADGTSAFTKALGLEFSAPPVGLMERSKRYSMVVEDGKVTVLNLEESPGVCEMSAAETLLDQL